MPKIFFSYGTLLSGTFEKYTAMVKELAIIYALVVKTFAKEMENFINSANITDQTIINPSHY